ncbi:hypothetical protein ES708_10029 [subsurface metagenome]
MGSKLINDVYVSSDADDILEISKNYGAKVIKRPRTIARDNSTSEEALKHAIAFIKKNIKEKIDIVVFCQATSPLRTSEDIDNAIKYFISTQADSLFSAVIFESLYTWRKQKRELISVSYDYKNRVRRQERPPLYLENGSIYIFKPEVLVKYNNRLGGKISMYIMDYWKSFDIDTIEDIEICEYFMRKKILSKPPRINKKDIQLIVYDFDGVMTNNKVIIDQNGEESVIVNRSDGLAISFLCKMRIKQIIISTEENQVVLKRAEKLKIPCMNGVKNKLSILKKYLKKNNILKENIIYVGNDINDFEAMKFVAFPVAPSDAHKDIRKIAKLVTKSKGGDGVIRELLDIFVEDKL